MLDDSRWQRLGLAGGVVFVVLNVVGALIAGTPPDPDSSGAKILEYLGDHDGALKFGAVLTGLALFFGLWWLGSLWRVMSAAESNGPRLSVVVVAAMVLGGALATVTSGLASAAAMRVDTLGEANASLIWSLGFVMLGLALGAQSIMMAALAVLTWRTKFLPTWTAYIAALSAIGGLIGVGAAGSQATAVVGIGFVSFMLWSLWILVASIVLMMRKPATTG